jgi:hypothetical protein
MGEWKTDASNCLGAGIWPGLSPTLCTMWSFTTYGLSSVLITPSGAESKGLPSIDLNQYAPAQEDP